MELNTMGVVAIWLILIALAMITVLATLAYFTRILWLAKIVDWLVSNLICFDNIPEGYATLYESGSGKSGKFFALACSYGEFAPIKAPAGTNLDWAIRRPGEKEIWPQYTDENGTIHKSEEKLYKKDRCKDPDREEEENIYFHWDRRKQWIRDLYKGRTGVVWMGRWPTVHPKEYNLRLSNFRTVKPSDKERAEKDADIREYKINGSIAGWLISWNAKTTRIGLFDDNYPVPVDGVRIGINKSKTEQEGIEANILVFLRARISNPRLYVYRVEDGLEMIQNEIIHRVATTVASMTIKQVYDMQSFLELAESPEAKENSVLGKNFKKYMEEQYGFKIEEIGFACIEPLGDAAKAIAAPYIARQNATAAEIKGEGEGNAEKARLLRVNEAFAKLTPEERLNLREMRTADVATAFAESGKASTVVLGFDMKNLLGGALGKSPEIPSPETSKPKPKTDKEEK